MEKKATINKPLEIAWLGRGGQGVVTACQILAKAALLEGKFAQAFPEFGPERTGAPVRGFNRISAEPINIHNQIYEPDVIVVIDPTLAGLLVSMNPGKHTKIILNGTVGETDAFFVVDATGIAMDIFGKPLFNTPMLGALVKVTGVVSMDSLKTIIAERFGGEVGQKNFSAIERAHREVKRIFRQQDETEAL